MFLYLILKIHYLYVKISVVNTYRRQGTSFPFCFMNQGTNYTEYTVTQKSEGKYKTRKLAMILLYVGFSLAYLILCGIFFPFAIMIFPLLLFILIFFTKKFIDVEHSYVTESGDITFYDVYGTKTKKERLKLKIKDMSAIAPMIDEYRSQFEAKDFAETYDFRGTVTSPDSYFGIFEKDGKKCLVMFEAMEKSLKVLAYYNSATVKSKTTY